MGKLLYQQARGREMYTVFENRRKSRIQHCERSELCLHFKWTKVHLKMPKIVHFGDFLKNPKNCRQKVLPDSSIFIGQKLVENAKNEK